MKQPNLYLRATLLANLAGVGGISLLIALPVGANPADNHNSAILNGAVAQRTNSRPDIFNNCRYNPASPGCSPSTPSPEQPPGSSTTGSENIVAVLESNRSFTTLGKALKAAQLEEILQGEGPFTLFAPTDEAFATLPQGAIQDLLKPENKEVLVKILKYHIVPGAVPSSTLRSGQIQSIEGGAITVKVDQQPSITVNDASVVQADIKASNGYIHMINDVILPPDL